MSKNLILVAINYFSFVLQFAVIVFILGRKSIPSWPWRLFCSFIVGLGWPIVFVYILCDWGRNIFHILVGWGADLRNRPRKESVWKGLVGDSDIK